MRLAAYHAKRLSTGLARPKTARDMAHFERHPNSRRQTSTPPSQSRIDWMLPTRIRERMATKHKGFRVKRNMASKNSLGLEAPASAGSTVVPSRLTWIERALFCVILAGLVLLRTSTQGVVIVNPKSG